MSKPNVYEIVTQKILDRMAQGVCPWRRPWTANAVRPFNAATGREYNGGNFLLLSMLGHDVPGFVTFNQIKAADATIKAGEEKNHFPVFYWRMVETKDANGVKDTFPILRYFLVWNVSQLDGFDSAKLQKLRESTQEYDHDPIEAAERIVQGYVNGPTIEIRQSNRACYYPANDSITVPRIEQYENVEEYYSTLFHELGHSTGHKSRLNRKEVNDPISFGSHDYSLEELVAELTATFLCAESGIDNTVENSAAYIKGWHAKLHDDPKMFWNAASRAQKAANLILGKTQGED